MKMIIFMQLYPANRSIGSFSFHNAFEGLTQTHQGNTRRPKKFDQRTGVLLYRRRTLEEGGGLQKRRHLHRVRRRATLAACRGQ